MPKIVIVTSSATSKHHNEDEYKDSKAQMCHVVSD